MSTLSALPSLGGIIIGAGRALRRFPFVIGAAVVSVFAAVLAIDNVGPDALQLRLLAAASLGIPLFIALAVSSERRFDSRAPGAVVAAVGALLLIGFYLWWPSWSEPVQVGRYMQASVAFHLAVAFLPFLGRSEPKAFWNYNRALLERFLTAAIYSGVLWAGLAIALAAIDQLLGVDVPEEGYGRLWVVAAFLFNTWFFLAGVPKDVAALQRRSGYPRPLKAFAQYALIPLVIVYLAILMIYFAKVVVTWDWPSGWIGWLVSSVAGVGIFALLLVHPIADDPANKWLKTFARWFFITLLPAILMLWLAIWQRIDQYGVTEPRYFLLILSIWLAGIAVYYTITRSRNIWIIPASLCVAAIVTFAGPWGAYRVSERSQFNRLEALLTEHGLLASGRAQPATTGEAPFVARREIAATIRYLLSTHGMDRAASWFGDELAWIDTVGSLTDPSAVDDRTREVVEHLGLEYVGRWQREPDLSFAYSTDSDWLNLPVAGFDLLVRIRDRRPTADADTGVVAWAVPRRALIQIRRRGEVLVEVPLDSVLVAAREYRRNNPDAPIPVDVMRTEVDAPLVYAVLYLSSLSGEEDEEGPTLRGVRGDVLVRLK